MDKTNVIDIATYRKRPETQQNKECDDLTSAIQTLIQRLREENPIQSTKESQSN